MNNTSYGADTSQARLLLNQIQTRYDLLYKLLKTQVEGDFIEPMSNYWYAPNAKDFFQQQFKPKMESLINKLNSSFNAIYRSIDDGLSATMSSFAGAWSASELNRQNASLDVSSIQDKKGTEIKCDTKEASALVDKLNTTIPSSASSACNELVSFAQGSGAFVNELQMSEIVKALQNLKNTIETEIQNLTSSAKANIDATTAQITTTGNQVKQQFGSTYLGG